MNTPACTQGIRQPALVPSRPRAEGLASLEARAPDLRLALWHQLSKSSQLTVSWAMLLFLIVLSARPSPGQRPQFSTTSDAREREATFDGRDSEVESEDIIFLSPRADQPAAGAVEFWIAPATGLETDLVIFRVDGREVGRFLEPPFRTTVQLDFENVEHTFEVVARNADREVARSRLVTPSLHVDDVIDLELRQLYVTVTLGGTRVTDLERDHFRVVDSGEPQTVVTFERGDAALAAFVLIDASRSMLGEPLQSALVGAQEFMSGLLEQDEAALMLFSDRTKLISDFLPAGDGLESALGEPVAGGGSAVNDHLYAALKLLDSRQGRRVAVLLSDGVDVESVLAADSVLRAAQRSQSIIYWIALRGREGTGFISQWHDVQEHADELATLKTLVEESGGRVLRIDDATEAPAVFAEILRELREQYVLGYYPTVNTDDGSWRSVRVRLEGKPRHRVRVRSGYWDVE